MGFNLKHLLNPFDKRNPLRPDNVAKDPLGLRATDLLSDPKKTGSSSIAGVTTDSTTGQISVWGVPITANPSDYPAHWYTNWQSTQAQTKMTFPEWVANVLTNAPQMAEEVTTWRKETGDVPLEQDLLDRVMSDYVNPALEKDKANQEKFKKLLESWQPTIDSNRKLVSELGTEDGETGHSVLATQELANLQDAIDTANASAADREKAKLGDIDTSLQEFLGAIDAQQASKRTNVDATLQKYLGSIDEQQASKRTNVDATLQKYLDAIADQRTAKYGELDTALADYLASIEKRQASKLSDVDPLLQSRLDAAESQASAASLGEQAARDQIAADMASQGYIGGSSFSDAQNARATIAARTAAAQALGTARIANATDVLNINNEATDSTYDTETGITTQRLGVGNSAIDAINKARTTAADQTLAVDNAAADSKHGARTTAADQTLAVDNAAADSIYKALTDASTGRLGVKNEASDAIYDAANWGAGQKLSYLDADNKRRLSNLETPIDLANQEVNLNTAIDNAGWAGLNRSLATLDWWKLANASGGGTTTAAPTTTDTTTGIAGAVGPSLVNAGLSIAQANNWWQKNKTTTPSPTTPSTK